MNVQKTELHARRKKIDTQKRDEYTLHEGNEAKPKTLNVGNTHPPTHRDWLERRERVMRQVGPGSLQCCYLGANRASFEINPLPGPIQTCQ